MYRIVRKEALKPTVILYEIEAPMVAKKAEPGQFIILRVDENGERIPITIHDYNREKGTVTIIVQTVGATTEKMNHLQEGERYKMVPKESKDLLAGHYGRLPGKVNEDVRKKCIGDTKVITHRYADDIPPELDKLREEMREWYQCEEDVLSYAMFPKVAPKFFEYRAAQQLKVDSTMLNKADKTMPV